MKYVLLLMLGSYIGIMVPVSSMVHTTLLHPLQLLFFGALVLLGPALFLMALTLTVKRRWEKQKTRIPLVVLLLPLIVVPLFTFGFGFLGSRTAPLFFSLVARENAAKAVAAMAIQPEGKRFAVEGMRYPYFSMDTTFAYHRDSVFFLVIPRALEKGNRLVFDPKNRCKHPPQTLFYNDWYLDTPLAASACDERRLGSP